MLAWILKHGRRAHLRARQRDLRHRIEQHDRYMQRAPFTLDELLCEVRRVDNALFAIENPRLFRRAVSGVYAPSEANHPFKGV